MQASTDLKRSLPLLSIAIGIALSVSGPAEELVPQTTAIETLVRGSMLHGIQGLVWGPDAQLYAGSISGQTISRIDPATGHVTTVVGPPQGEADDLAVAPDGSLAWTAIVAGELRYKSPGGNVRTLASGLPGVNPVTFGPDGRLFVGQLGPVNALFEVDPRGRRPLRLITNSVDQLNSFELGTDGRLYGPFWQSGVLVAIDTSTGAVARLARISGTPSAVSFDPSGQLISIDYNTGALRRTDPKTGKSSLIATLEPPNDNLAVGSDGTIYVSDTARSSIIAVNPLDATQRRLLGGEFATVGGLALTVIEGRETIVAADSTGYRFVDPSTGAVTRPPFDMSLGGSIDIAATDAAVVTTDVRLGRLRKIDRRTRVLLADIKDLKAPTGVTILDDGDIVIAEYASGELARISGGVRTVLARGLRGPVGLARDSGGALLVSEHRAGVISSVDLHDGARRELARGFDRPEGLARMKDGRIAVAEAGKRRVVAVDITSTVRAVLADDLPLGATAVLTPPAVGMPAGVVVDRAGAIYVSCDGDNSIRKIVISKPRS